MAPKGFQGESRYRYIESLKSIEKAIMNKKMMDQLSEIIANVKAPGPHERTTGLYRKLVEKLKPEIRAFEKDPEVCNITARKLAKFIEGVMLDACILEKSKTFIASRHRPVMSDEVMNEINKLQTRTKRPIYLKKISRRDADKIPRTGPIYTATVAGRRVYVEDVHKNDGKALITMPCSSDKIGGEWTSWLIDIQADTIDWVRWLDDEASAFDSSSRDERPSCSSFVDNSRTCQRGDWNERRKQRLFFDTPSTDKFWKTASGENLTSSRSASSIDLNVHRSWLRTPKKPRVAEKISIPKMPPRPKTAVDLTANIKGQQQLRTSGNLDFRILYAPGAKKAGGIVFRE